MTSPTQEPHDHYTYRIPSFPLDAFEYFTAAVEFYRALLDSDIHALESDQDLARLVPERERTNLPIYRESARIGRLIDWMKERMSAKDVETWGLDISIAHGTVRLIKSAAILYLKKLRISRQDLAMRANVSRCALDLVDQKLARYEELTGMGVFASATPQSLLVAEVLPTAPRIEDSGGGDRRIADAQRPHAVVISTIEVLDPQLRTRCLDLLDKFHTDAQHERLDTVVGEALRILEDRLRRNSEAPANTVGMELASYAFTGANPRLVVSEVEAEQKAAHLLFMGTFGYLRNHVLHNLVEDLSPQRALQIVGFVDYLLSVVDASSSQVGDSGA